MIAIEVVRCTGCGACVEACPTAALYLVDGKAAVDERLCRGCEACITACPRGAIAMVSGDAYVPRGAAVPALRREPEVVLERRPLPGPDPGGLALHTSALPALATVLAWAGREIVPRLANLLLDRLDRGRASAARQGCPGRGQEGRGRQRRRSRGGHRRA